MQGRRNRRLIRAMPLVLSMLLLVLLFNLIAPATVFARSDTLEITGAGVTNPIVLTRAQLEEMKQGQVVYSSINTWPSKKWYVGQGVKLWDLLLMAGINKEEATLFKFTAVDGYTVTLTFEELFQERRYRFPNFKSGVTGEDLGGEGHLPGSSADKIEVEPLIGLLCVEGSANPEYMNDIHTLILMLGQRTVTEQVGNLFVKYLNKIEVFTDEPEQWDTPQANPEAGPVLKGTMVTLSNLHNDDDKIYYTMDGSTPTMSSPMYNWIASRWWSTRADVLGKINHPLGPINENTAIKAVTIGPGKRDSEIVTFNYRIAAAEPGDGDGAGSTDPGQDPEPGKELADLEGHWAEKAIKELVASGAVAGYPDGTFQPNKTITRAEFAAILIQAFHLEPKAGQIFNDTAGHWAEKAIATAQAHGIVGGYSETIFGPNDYITREQMAVMITRAAGLSAVGPGKSFMDGSRISSWAREAVAAASEKGIISGYPDNTFQPQGRATRAEAASVIVKAIK